MSDAPDDVLAGFRARIDALDEQLIVYQLLDQACGRVAVPRRQPLQRALWNDDDDREIVLNCGIGESACRIASSIAAVFRPHLGVGPLVCGHIRP